MSLLPIFDFRPIDPASAMEPSQKIQHTFNLSSSIFVPPARAPRLPEQSFEARHLSFNPHPSIWPRQRAEEIPLEAQARLPQCPPTPRRALQGLRANGLPPLPPSIQSAHLPTRANECFFPKKWGNNGEQILL